MADILACIPKHCLESVLVAAELILESGNTSAEHHQEHTVSAQGSTAAANRRDRPDDRGSAAR